MDLSLSQMGYADFCMDPTESTLTVVGEKKNQQTLDTIEYYTSCEGSNPFADELGLPLCHCVLSYISPPPQITLSTTPSTSIWESQSY
jgi:hypothetical protein